MLAGSGSIFAQQYDLPPLFGGVLMTVLVIATLCMNVKRIIDLISAVMPFLLAMVLIITTYSIFSYNAPIETLDAVENPHRKVRVQPHAFELGGRQWLRLGPDLVGDPDPAEVELLGYRRNDVANAVADVAKQFG